MTYSQQRILIVGLSTRAIAESAVRGGYEVITLDYFGDRDQKELVENYSLMRDFHLGFSAEDLLTASRQLDFEAVVYISNLENHPDVVEELAHGHTLVGNSPQTLREVRHWPTLRSFCREEGIAFPPTIFADEERPTGEDGWLRKPVRSGGGHDISFWEGNPIGEGHLLQEYIDGRHCSAAFVADGGDCVLIGVTEQLIGREELGARGFTWCGNILPLALSPRGMDSVLDVLGEIAFKLTRRFGLRGANGFDFVLATREGYFTPYLVEVNPRYTASMELMEWAYGLNIFDLHVRSSKGELPSFSLREQHRQARFYGKGIVYAKSNVVMPETAGWRAKGRRDIPFPGERIVVRHPICTVLAQGESRDECWHCFLAAADAVRQEIKGEK
ncbi:MAG: ATP-grasp domain-containing protein [Anaerolineae bacterium]|nr:ATP-grasp domain-containing protein [Anaerolineae bacterium]